MMSSYTLGFTISNFNLNLTFMSALVGFLILITHMYMHTYTNII